MCVIKENTSTEANHMHKHTTGGKTTQSEMESKEDSRGIKGPLHAPSFSLRLGLFPPCNSDSYPHDTYIGWADNQYILNSVSTGQTGFIVHAQNHRVVPVQ